jgi:hypothetical protein
LTSTEQSGEAGLRSPRCRYTVKNMFVFAIVAGAIWVFGIFAFWCDVTDSWKNVSRRVSALLPPYSKSPPAPPD